MSCRMRNNRRFLMPLMAIVLALAMIVVQPPGLNWAGFVAWAQGVCGIAAAGDPGGGFQIDGQFYSGPDADDWAQGGSYVGVILDDGTANLASIPSMHDRDAHCAGGAKDPTIFSESNKNNDPIHAAGTEFVWHFSEGDTPQKNDLTDIYAHAKTFQVAGETEVWLLLGAMTRAANGDSHFDFEWNIAGVEMITYGRANDGEIVGYGPDFGRTAYTDFIISIDFEIGGTTPSVRTYQWQETSTDFFEYVEFEVPEEDVLVCTDLDGALVPPWGAITPGGRLIKPPATATPLQFVEMGINLEALGLTPIDLCSFTSTLLFKTRSSSSFTAELKDFALYPFELVTIPECSLDGADDYCQDDFPSEGITISSTVTPEGGSFSYQWYLDGTLVDGATGTSFTLPPQTPGTYSISLIVEDNATGCQGTACVTTVTVFEAPQCTLSDPGDFCPSDFPTEGVTVTNTPSGGTGPYTYEWWVDDVIQAETGAVLTVTAGSVGLHTVESRVTDAYDCDGELCSVSYTIFENPTCSLSDPGDFCQDQFVDAVITNTPSGGTAPFTYEWWVNGVSQAATGSSLTVTDSSVGTYLIESIVTDVNDCVSVLCDVSYEVYDNPTCSLSDPGDFCQDDFFEAVITNTPTGAAPFTYVWWVNSVLQAETGNQLTVTDNTVRTYFVESRVTDSQNCVSDICTVTYEIWDSPACALSDPGNFCQDQFVEAEITNTPTGGTPPFTYEWWVNGGLQAEIGNQLTVTDNTVGSYVITSTVTDSQDCVSDICEVIYEIIPNPLCEILAPDPLPSCGTDAYQLCATEDNLDYTYSWELISAPAGWELVPPTDEYCVIYNTGNLGEATFELTVTDQYGCEGTCEVTFGCEPSGEFCSFTQGFYGNAGGDWNGMGTLEIIQGLITPTDPMVLGVLGTRSVTFADGSELCIIARLPGDGPDMPLPDGLGDQIISPMTCQTDPPLPTRKGRFSNGFLIRTIALSLNVRLGDDGDLATVGLCFFMTTQAALCGDDGICGTADDIPDPGPDGINGTGDEDIVTFYIPSLVIEALDNLGLDITVGGLLELANRGLAGMDTGGASLSEIKAAVIAINEAFDDCRFLIGCSDAPSGRDLPTEFRGDGWLRTEPLAFALSPNTPNPVREGTSIRFALPEASRVKIAVYNLRGQLVSVVEDRVIPAGYHTAHWHPGGHAAAAGVYFYRMQAVGMESGKTFSHTQKMVVVR